MAWNALVNSATGKIFPSLIPEGGGVALTKGQLISANAAGLEVPVPVGADGTILSADSNSVNGLSYVVVPGAVPLSKGQLIAGDAANTPTIVTAPAFPAQEGWVLTATSAAVDGTGLQWKDAGQATFTAAGQMQYGGAAPLFPDTPLNIGTAGQILKVNPGATAPVWDDVGGGGTITAVLPLVESAVGNTSQIALNFAAGPAGQIPYGNGTALTGALTNTPTANQVLGVSAGVPAWIDLGASGSVTATPPLVESAGVGNASNIAINFTTKAQIPVGTGAGTGILLPQSATDGYVLSAAAAEASGVKWVPGGSPAAQNNFFELEFPAAPPFTNVGNVVTLPAPSTIATFTKNEQITIMNYETQGAPGGNTFAFKAVEWGNFRGGISGLNTGGNESFFYYAYFQSTQIMSLYRTPLPLTADSPVGEYLGGIAQASSGDPTCKVNGVIRTANFIYFFGLFENYIASGVAPNTAPFVSLGNVIKYNMTTGAFSPCGTASGVSGLYGGPNACVNCACACPTTEKSSGQYVSRPHSVVFGGTFTSAQNSTLGSQYIAYYEEGGDNFDFVADGGATGITSPAQTQSADNEGLYGCSALMFSPDTNGMIVVCNFATGVYAPTGSVTQPIRNGVFVYQNVTSPQIQSLGTLGQINNSKNIEYAAGLVRKTSDNSLWLCLGYTDNSPTQNCWWYNLAGAGTGDALVSPTGNPTPPFQVSSGGCDLPENLLYAYGLLNDVNGTSAVSWFNPPIVAATYPDGGTYVWEDNQGTSDTYAVVYVAPTTQLTYTGINNGAKSWSGTSASFAALSINQSLLPAIVIITTGPSGEGGRAGSSYEITDQFVGVLAFAGNGLQYIAANATFPAITKQIIFKTQFSSIQMIVDTTADIYRVVNDYGVIEYT